MKSSGVDPPTGREAGVAVAPSAPVGRLGSPSGTGLPSFSVWNFTLPTTSTCSIAKSLQGVPRGTQRRGYWHPRVVGDCRQPLASPDRPRQQWGPVTVGKGR